MSNMTSIFYFIFLFISDSKSTILPIPIIGMPDIKADTIPIRRTIAGSSMYSLDIAIDNKNIAIIPIVPAKYKKIETTFDSSLLLSGLLTSSFTSSCLVSSDIKTLPFKNIYLIYRQVFKNFNNFRYILYIL